MSIKIMETTKAVKSIAYIYGNEYQDEYQS